MTYSHILYEDLFFFSRSQVAKEFSNDWLKISPKDNGAEIQIVRGYAYDGYSLVPDLPCSEPSAIHDAIYQFAEAIAKAWGWTVKQVLKWADKIFLEAMVFFNTPIKTAALYYYGVRLGGYAYHQVALVLRPIWKSIKSIFRSNLEVRDS